jgi:hypothetical protein
VLLSYYFIVTGCKLGNPSSTSDNQQHGCSRLVTQAMANCTVARNIFNLLVHITKKRKQIDLKAKEINWLLGRKSNLSLENKLLVYKAVIKPIWTYGIELLGCASKSNTAIMQSAQSKILRTITNAPRYVTKRTLHTDLNLHYVSEVIYERINKHLSKLKSHPNPLVETLTQPTRNRRLKRRWTSDLHD